MGNSRSSFSESFTSTFNTKNFRSVDLDEAPDTMTRRRERGSRRTNRARRRSVSVDVRGRRRMSSVIHENLVKINVLRNVRDVYSGVDSRSNFLGEGTWGTVKLVRRRSNPKFKAAVKILKLSKDMKNSRMKELRTEISLLQQIDHPHIAKLYETFEEEGLNLYLVMEYLGGGELFDRVINLGNFRESKAAEAVKQMVGAVKYLHDKGIVHRDLKLENFMYRSKNSDKLVLIDFGLSTRYADTGNDNKIKSRGSKKFLKEMVGSSYYMAPEVMRRKYGRECDMWSIGVIAYMLLSGHPPFAGDTDDEIMRRVKKGKFHFNHSAFKKVTENAIEFLKGLLVYDPANRMDAAAALAHPWLSDHHKKVVQRRSQRRGSVVDLQVVNNLKSFVETNRLKKVALQAVAYSTRYEDIAHLQELFTQIDQDQDGYITLEELQNAMKDDPSVSPKVVKKIFKAMDIDKTQKVHLNEFIAATMNKSLIDDERILREAFRKLDVHEHGEITKEDLVELLGNSFSDEQVTKMFEEFTKGTSEKKLTKLTMEEFISAMRRAKQEETKTYMIEGDGEDETDLDSEQGSIPI